MGVLHVLGRGTVFHTLEGLNGISRSTNNAFFRRFVRLFSRHYYKVCGGHLYSVCCMLLDVPLAVCAGCAVCAGWGGCGDSLPVA